MKKLFICDCSKICHITLIVCAPYFVNLNTNTFQIKRYYSLFITFTAKENKKLSPVIKFTVLPMFKMSAFSVDTGRQTTPPLIDVVVYNRLVQFAPHGDQTFAQLVDVLYSVVVRTLHTLFCTFFSGFGSAKIIKIC